MAWLEMIEWRDSDAEGSFTGSEVGDLHAPPETVNGKGQRE
jgi:hypothetical protein